MEKILICNYKKCKNIAVPNRKMCEYHAKVFCERTRRITQKYQLEGKCRYCPEPHLEGYKVCQYHMLKNRERCSKQNARLKKEVLIQYGNTCVYCGENNFQFLTIDHKNDNGNEHRKETGSGSGFYYWLKRNNYPQENFQILCWNCNAAKSIYGQQFYKQIVPKDIKMNQILVILQGHSGAGKTTLGNQIAKVIDAEIFSTDDFHIENDKYIFKPEKLGLYHKLNQDRSIKAMQDGKNVIIDNTNLCAWECSEYVKAAVKLNITVKFVRATGNFQNTHGVPEHKVLQMKEKMEELSLEGCLNAKPPW